MRGMATMEKLKIHGGRRLEGCLTVQGSKNSVLPILAATILVRGESILRNCPELKDVDAAISILRHLGCQVTREGKDIHVDSTTIVRCDIPDELMREMRSSVIFLGAILGRVGEAELSMPGGCELGPRPIDLHLNALRAMGAEVQAADGTMNCRAGRLHGAKIDLPIPSVGATENAMLAAVAAVGETVIANAAREPEIVDLQNFLLASGAKIRGAGQSTITVIGGGMGCSVEHRIIPDRIVAATYLSAVAFAGGRLVLKDGMPAHVKAVTTALQAAGCEINVRDRDLELVSSGALRAISPVITRPYPGFATDAQPCLLAAATKSAGTCVFIENIFQNRYRYVEELRRMGADIRLEGRVAVVTGVAHLTGATVTATDLRGGAALVVAALGAQGETEIFELDHMDRGYDDFAGNLRQLGAEVMRIAQ